MLSKTRDKILKDIKKRCFRVPQPKQIDTTPATETIIKYVLSYLPKKMIRYAEQRVYFHEPHRIGSETQAFALCIKMETKQADYTIILDSAFRNCSMRYKMVYVAHELGHVFWGSDEKKDVEWNEDAAGDFLEYYYLTNNNFRHFVGLKVIS